MHSILPDDINNILYLIILINPFTDFFATSPPASYGARGLSLSNAFSTPAGTEYQGTTYLVNAEYIHMWITPEVSNCIQASERLVVATNNGLVWSLDRAVQAGVLDTMGEVVQVNIGFLPTYPVRGSLPLVADIFVPYMSALPWFRRSQEDILALDV